MNKGTLVRGLEAWKTDRHTALPRTLFWLRLDSLNRPRTENFSVGMNGSRVKAQAMVNGYEEIHRFVELGGEEEYLAHFCETFARFPNSLKTVFYDVGAEVGIFSILAAKIHPRATIIPFEPMPKTFRKLLGNMRQNHFTNVIPMEMGLSDKIGTEAIYFGGKTCPSLTALNATHQSKQTSIELTTLDNLILRQQYPRPSVVKIDVEGSEKKVLKGASEVLRLGLGPAYFFIEAHLQYGINPEQLAEDLYQYGYQCVSDTARFLQTEQHLMVFCNPQIAEELIPGWEIQADGSNPGLEN